MSRYKVTTGELLEQVRQESKMKDIYTMAFNGDSAEEIAKAMKLDVDTVKKVLGERFNMSDFKDNEKDNKHSENALELAKQFGTGKEIHDMKAIIKFVNQRGYINKPMYDVGYKITKKYASKLEAYREVQEDWSDTNKRNPQKHTSTSKTSDEDKLKSLENEVQRLKLELENEKNATVKPEPNPETGEVPLTVGIAHKYLKDKKDKQDKKVKKGYHTMPDGTMMKDSEHTKEEVEVIDEATLDQFVHFLKKQGFVGVDTAVAKGMSQGIHLSKMQAFVAQQLNKSKNPFGEESELVGVKYDSIIEEITIEKLEESLKVKWDAVNKGWYDEKGRRRYLSIGATNKLMRKGIEKAIKTGDWTSSFELKHGFKPEGYELTEYFATVHSDKKPIIDFVKAYARKPANMKNIDYVDDDAGGNIEFEGKSAHELADKVKAKFGVRITKESFEPIEDKSLSELTANDPMSKSYLYLTKSMDVKYIYTRNPELFDKTLDTSKTGKALKNVGPKLKGVYVLKGTGQQHIEFLKTLNNKGIMPKNKILGEELEEDTNKYITEKIKGLEDKAEKSNIPYSILKKVYDRGMVAWKGVHRPGDGQQQWAFARVNSFVTESSGTWGKADTDLAKQVRASESLEQEGLINFGTSNPEYSAHTQDKGIISFIGQQLDFGPKRFIYVTSYNKNGKIVFGGKGGKKVADYIKSKGFKVTKESLEEETDIQESRLPSFKDLVKYKYADDHAGAIHFSKIGGKEYHWNYLGREGGKYSISTKKTGEIRVSRAGADYKINKVINDEVEIQERSGFKMFSTPKSMKRQLKDKEKEMLVSKDNKVIVIDKSEWDKYKAKGYIQAEDKEEENEACWDSHKQVGTKMKGGKTVPNCVPKNEKYTRVGSAKLTPAQKKFQDVLQRATKDKEDKKAAYLKIKNEEINIDGYDGARNLVDRLLNKRGDK